MEIGKKLKDFITNIATEEADYIQRPKFDLENGDTRDAREIKEEEKELQRKAADDAKRAKKIGKLRDSLKQIKSELKNKNLSPLRRLILSLKLDLIETKLDKQLVKQDIQEWVDRREDLKERKAERMGRPLDVMKAQYNELYDRRADLEKELAVLVAGVKEERKAFENGQRPVLESDVRPGDANYIYKAMPSLKEQLNQKRLELDEVISKQKEVDYEIEDLQMEIEDMQDRIDDKTDKTLKKYGRFALSMAAVRAFFERAGETISKWARGGKDSKDTKKSKVKEPKVEDKKQEPKVVTPEPAVEDIDLDRIVENQKEAEAILDSVHVPEDVTPVAEVTSIQLFNEMLERAKSGQSVEGYVERIAELREQEKQAYMDQHRQDTKEPSVEPVVEDNKTDAAPTMTEEERLDAMLKGQSVPQPGKTGQDRIREAQENMMTADELAKVMEDRAQKGLSIEGYEDRILLKREKEALARGDIEEVQKLQTERAARMPKQEEKDKPVQEGVTRAQMEEKMTSKELFNVMVYLQSSGKNVDGYAERIVRKMAEEAKENLYKEKQEETKNAFKDSLKVPTGIDRVHEAMEESKTLEERYNDYMKTIEDTPERRARVAKYNKEYEQRQEVMRRMNQNLKKQLNNKKDNKDSGDSLEK